MTVDKTELVKQAYAYGCSVALTEVGYDKKTAEETAVKLAEESPSHAKSDRLKEAYAQGAAKALKEAGYKDEEITPLATKLAEAQNVRF